jgi:CHASE3 domain sensor protein
MDVVVFKFIGELFQNGNTILIPVVIYFMWNNNSLIKSITSVVDENSKLLQKATDVIQKCKK